MINRFIMFTVLYILNFHFEKNKVFCNLGSNNTILPTRSPFGPEEPTGPGLPRSP